jgi:hypothetical protein
MRDEDDAWLDMLAGRADTEHADESNAHARAIRAAILSRRAAENPVAGEDAAREQALIDRARAAGLLRPAAARHQRPRRALWLSAAALACVAVAVTLEMRIGPPAPVTRSGAPLVTHIRAPDPLRLKQEIIRELAAAGVDAHGYEVLGREGIDADLPLPVARAVREVLARHGIAAPEDGVLQVEIEPETP